MNHPLTRIDRRRAIFRCEWETLHCAHVHGGALRDRYVVIIRISSLLIFSLTHNAWMAEERITD